MFAYNKAIGVKIDPRKNEYKKIKKNLSEKKTLATPIAGPIFSTISVFFFSESYGQRVSIPESGTFSRYLPSKAGGHQVNGLGSLNN